MNDFSTLHKYRIPCRRLVVMTTERKGVSSALRPRAQDNHGSQVLPGAYIFAMKYHLVVFFLNHTKQDSGLEKCLINGVTCCNKDLSRTNFKNSSVMNTRSRTWICLFLENLLHVLGWYLALYRGIHVDTQVVPLPQNVILSDRIWKVPTPTFVLHVM